MDIYILTKQFPNEEKFGLVSQIRRSASSVPTNIIEGHRRKSRKEFLYFLNMADSSLEETKYHIILSRDLGYIDLGKFDNLLGRCEEIGKMLFVFQKRLMD